MKAIRFTNEELEILINLLADEKDNFALARVSNKYVLSIKGNLFKLIMKKLQNNFTTLDELGGSCIIPNIHNKRRDTDYDGYNDYQRIIIEGE